MATGAEAVAGGAQVVGAEAQAADGALREEDPGEVAEVAAVLAVDLPEEDPLEAVGRPCPWESSRPRRGQRLRAFRP